MPIPAWIALSGVFVGACVCVCHANPLSRSLEWKAEAHCWWRGEGDLQAPLTVGLCSRGSPLPQLLTHSLGHMFSSFMSLPSSSLSCCLSPFWTSFPLSDITFLSYLPRLLLCILFTFCSFIHLSLSFSSPAHPPPSPPRCPKEIWFPPLPGLFTIVPVCMADKDHIALSIWRHLSKLLYTWPFTHLHTLNSIETTSILCVLCVC